MNHIKKRVLRVPNLLMIFGFLMILMLMLFSACTNNAARGASIDYSSIEIDSEYDSEVDKTQIAIQGNLVNQSDYDILQTQLVIGYKAGGIQNEFILYSTNALNENSYLDEVKAGLTKRLHFEASVVGQISDIEILEERFAFDNPAHSTIDPTILGVLIGGAFTLLGTIVTIFVNYISDNRRDAKKEQLMLKRRKEIVYVNLYKLYKSYEKHKDIETAKQISDMIIELKVYGSEAAFKLVNEINPSTLADEQLKQKIEEFKDLIKIELGITNDK